MYVSALEFLIIKFSNSIIPGETETRTYIPFSHAISFCFIFTYFASLHSQNAVQYFLYIHKPMCVYVYSILQFNTRYIPPRVSTPTIQNFISLILYSSNFKILKLPYEKEKTVIKLKLYQKNHLLTFFRDDNSATLKESFCRLNAHTHTYL